MATWVNLMDIVYPVGSIYLSVSSTSPSSIIGGTWSQITNAVIRGSGGGYKGSDTHTLTINEMPAHHHSDNGAWGVQVVVGGGLTDGDISGSWTAGLLQAVLNPVVGGGTAFSLLPRYYGCYIWYRTA